MANLLKKKGRYYLQFYDQSCRGQRKTISLKAYNKATAQTLKAYHEAEYALGKWSPWESPQNALWGDKRQTEAHRSPTVLEAVEAFLESRASCRKATRDHYRWVLIPLGEHLGKGMLVSDLSSSKLAKWMSQLSANPVTRKTYLSRVGIFARWCVQQGWLTTDITKQVVHQRVPDKLSSKLISPEQVEQLIQAAERSETPYMADVIAITYDHALRLSETCALKWSWLDLETRTLTVQSDEDFCTKAGRSVVKPLSERAYFMLSRKDRKDAFVLRNSVGRRLTPKHTSKTFKKLVRSVGLPESITFNSLRHGSLSRLIRSGVPIEAVRLFAGHSSIAMTMRYVHLSGNHYLDAIRQATERTALESVEN